MAVTHIGIQVPSDYNRNGDPLDTGVSEDEETEWDIHPTVDGVGVLIGTSHVDVGLVTWWRADLLLEAYDFVERLSA